MICLIAKDQKNIVKNILKRKLTESGVALNKTPFQGIGSNTLVVVVAPDANFIRFKILLYPPLQ